MATLYVFQSEQVASRLSECKAKQGRLTKVEKAKETVQSKADAVRDVMMQRTAWLKRVDAIRKSLFDGMWLTQMMPVKDENGKVTGVRIVGRGWSDKVKEVEEKAKAAGRNATALEELRDRLKTQSVFGKEPQDVKIVGVKEIEAYMIEFTIEAVLASTSVPKDATAR